MLKSLFLAHIFVSIVIRAANILYVKDSPQQGDGSPESPFGSLDEGFESIKQFNANEIKFIFITGMTGYMLASKQLDLEDCVLTFQ